MKRIMVATLALIVMVSLTIPALASAAEVSKGDKVTGTIQSIDATSNSLTLETAQGKKTTYTVDTQTTIQVAGKACAMADLKVGQTVTVEAQGSKALAIEG
jgi:beta-lactamase regulating signal transducer with metallopeptidase domain